MSFRVEHIVHSCRPLVKDTLETHLTVTDCHVAETTEPNLFLKNCTVDSLALQNAAIHNSHVTGTLEVERDLILENCTLNGALAGRNIFIANSTSDGLIEAEQDILAVSSKLTTPETAVKNLVAGRNLYMIFPKETEFYAYISCSFPGKLSVDRRFCMLVNSNVGTVWFNTKNRDLCGFEELLKSHHEF